MSKAALYKSGSPIGTHLLFNFWSQAGTLSPLYLPLKIIDYTSPVHLPQAVPDQPTKCTWPFHLAWLPDLPTWPSHLAYPFDISTVFWSILYWFFRIYPRFASLGLVRMHAQTHAQIFARFFNLLVCSRFKFGSVWQSIPGSSGRHFYFRTMTIDNPLASFSRHLYLIRCFFHTKEVFPLNIVLLASRVVMISAKNDCDQNWPQMTQERDNFEQKIILTRFCGVFVSFCGKMRRRLC